jgi:hypothetical protein
LGVEKDDEIEITAQGSDETSAVTALEKLVRTDLAGKLQPLSAAWSAAGKSSTSASESRQS